MEQVLREVKGKGCMVYIDDLVVYTKNISEHLQLLQQVFIYKQAFDTIKQDLVQAPVLVTLL